MTAINVFCVVLMAACVQSNIKGGVECILTSSSSSSSSGAATSGAVRRFVFFHQWPKSMDPLSSIS